MDQSKTRAQEYFLNQLSKLDKEQRIRFESHKLYPLFYPGSIALVGVSSNINYGAASFMEAFKSMHYPEFGNLYPINPKHAGKELHGFMCYDSLASLPESPDYILYGLPADMAPGLIEQAIQIEAKFVIMFTSGFGEISTDKGRNLNNKILSILDSNENNDGKGGKKTRIIGPNCLGIYNPSGGLSFFQNQCDNMYGGISIISQSGGQGELIINYFTQREHYVRMCASVGNIIDIGFSEILDFYGADPFTKAIGCYMEGFNASEGKRLITQLKILANEKPVLIWKTGKMKEAITAISSHTGALAGDAKVFEGAMRQAGVVITHSMESLFDSASAILLSSAQKNNGCPQSINESGTDSFQKITQNILKPSINGRQGVGIVVSGGGFSVDTIDTFSFHGITKADLSKDTINNIAKIIPDINTFIVNPVDIGDKGYTPEIYHRALELCAADKNVNLIVSAREVERFAAFGDWLDNDDIAKNIIDAIKQVQEKYKKPILLIVPEVQLDIDSFKDRQRFIRMLKKINTPSFPTVERAAIAAKALIFQMQKEA